MLKTVDIFIGLSLVMLLVSMIITVITQALTTMFNSRGKHLAAGVADLLEQLHSGITRQIAEEISTAALKHPLVCDVNGGVGGVIHREELTKLLLELGTGDGPMKLGAAAQSALQTALVENGICQPGAPEQIQAQIREKLKNVRALALHLELTHPELANAARARVAFLQQANSEFLAKINLWFDQTMDRTSERFTAHTRYVTFFAGFAVALALQLDTASLVSRLSTDAALRNSLLDIAKNQAAQGFVANTSQSPASGQNTAPGTSANGAAAAFPVRLTDIDQQNLKDVMVNNIVGIPQSWSDWTGRWHKDNFLMKLLGILLTTLLLSLGAPFWYGALQNLLRLRSLIATKDDDQRNARQTNTPSVAQVSAPDGVVLTDERGDLTVVA